MNKKVLNFLKKNKISVLTTLLPNGNPHSATMHFAEDPKSLKFVFFTKALSRKCKHFSVGKKYPASIVVGFDENEMIEFQSEGKITKVNLVQSKLGVKIFAKKYSGAELDEEHIVLVYEPTWWRYTEFKPKFMMIKSN